jgi:hypothetical protein
MDMLQLIHGYYLTDRHIPPCNSPHCMSSWLQDGGLSDEPVVESLENMTCIA